MSPLRIIICDKVGHIWAVWERARAKLSASQAHRKTLAFAGIIAVSIFTVQVGDVSNFFRFWCLLEHDMFNGPILSEPPSSTNWVSEMRLGQVAVTPHCYMLEGIFCWG